VYAFLANQFPEKWSYFQNSLKLSVNYAYHVMKRKETQYQGSESAFLI